MERCQREEACAEQGWVSGWKKRWEEQQGERQEREMGKTYVRRTWDCVREKS